MIYVTLTTVPDRINSEYVLRECLDSLLNQSTDQEYKIVLNIPMEYKNYGRFDIPEWLLSYNEKITIIRDEIDYGPISNILYPIKHIPMNGEDLLIVVDDDHYYHQDLIKHHLTMLKKYPENHAICYRGNRPMEMRTWDEDGKRVGVFLQTHAYFPVRKDIYLKLPDHWHSVSYRRKWLQDDIFDPEFLAMTWNNDNLMGHYAYHHGFYFLCAFREDETDFRPVNDYGKGSASYPIVRTLPTEGASGCNLWRQKDTQDVTQNPKFMELFAEKGVIEWRYHYE
jgi:hypothetical protein